jgi:hypothetical protein
MQPFHFQPKNDGYVAETFTPVMLLPNKLDSFPQLCLSFMMAPQQPA